MTPEALVLCTLARHGLLGTDLPDMLDLWPEVAVVCRDTLNRWTTDDDGALYWIKDGDDA